MYNFESIIPRKGSHCVKWDHPLPFEVQCPEDVIPMWVADMDFPVAPFIVEAIMRRAQHPVFGYTQVPGQYYQAVLDWYSSKHGVDFRKDWIIYTTGVVPAISAVLRGLTRPGDKVIIQTPVYNCFFSSIRNLECQVVENPLVQQMLPSGEFTYKMDFEQLEQLCKDPQAKVLLLCNPHNPAARVWTKEELARVGKIAAENGVTVVSDEIHCEIVMPGYRFTPFAAASDLNMDNCVTLCSPSKSFNIAGLQTANIIVKDPVKRAAIDRGVNIHEVCDLNPFGPEALIAAYSEQGKVWLSEMNDAVYANYKTLCLSINQTGLNLPIAKLEGTYLAWVDVRSLHMSGTDVEKALLGYGVWVNNGHLYGNDNFIRINLATPATIFNEGCSRICKGLESIAK